MKNFTIIMTEKTCGMKGKAEGCGGRLVQACEQPRREGHTLQMSGELVGI